jgi:anaerobic magnesium-protoporphyrin IX monomethyl ester cyclase
MAEVLLMQPPLPPPMNSYAKEVVLSPPLGLCYIASNISQNLNADTSIVDCSILNLNEQQIRNEIEKCNPKILGISTTTHTYKNALKIAKLAKTLNIGITTVLGGPHSSIRDNETLQNEDVDIVVRQEGEFTMLELADILILGKGEISSVKGITYREKGSVLRNPDRPLIQDLDILPFPKRRLLPLDLYKVPATIITSRGCPSGCIFCAAKALSGSRYRVRSPENVVEETKQIYSERNPQFLFIADDTFTVFHDRTRQICKSYRDLGIKWVCESRVNTISGDMVKEMADSGCFMIQFGVESGSQAILDSIRKGITVDQVRKAVSWCVDYGVKPVCSFMIPHPDDTWKTIQETESLMEELKDLGVQIFVSLTTPFPGTFLYDNAENLGVEFVTQDTDEFNLATPVIRTKYLSVEEIEKAFERLAKISMQTLPPEMMEESAT